MTSDTVWQLIRYALLLAFAPLVNEGYISSDQVTTTLGAIGALFTVGWESGSSSAPRPPRLL